MYKIKYFLFIFILILCVNVPSTVYASDDFQPYLNLKPFNISIVPDPNTAPNYGYAGTMSFSCSDYCVYSISNFYPFPSIPERVYTTVNFFACNIGSAPSVTYSNNVFQSASTHFSFTYNNEPIDIYYTICYTSYEAGVDVKNDKDEIVKLSYDIYPSGGGYCFTSFGTQQERESLAKYILFGVGDFNIELPADDLPDSELDIHGLNGWVGSDQYIGADDNSISVAFDNFIQALFDRISSLPVFSAFIDRDKVFPNKLGYVNTTVPGCNMIWDTPSVGVNILASDDFPIYTIWVDGSASAELSVYGQTYNADVSFSKLQLFSGQLRDNPSTTSYYNSNSSYQVILNYIQNNSNFVSSTYSGFDQTILNTYIKRLYIQASKVDINGDNHFGAISYIDFNADGSVVVHEGVTEDLSDILESDDDGVDNTVTQPYTVSGDTIIYGDTITNNNTTINYVPGGLSVGDGSFLDAGIALINAILELIKLLFASWLVPFITLGWTGHF